MSGELIYTLQTPKDIVTREKGGADSLPGFACGDTVDVVLLKKKPNENMGKPNNSCNLV